MSAKFAAQLQRLASRPQEIWQRFRLVKQPVPKASLNLLWALAAGLEGQDWREMTETTKKRLRKEAEE